MKNLNLKHLNEKLNKFSKAEVIKFSKTKIKKS